MITFSYFTILVLTLVLYWIIRRQSSRNILLVVSSLLFIYSLDKWSVAVVLSLSIVSYGFGLLIKKNPNQRWVHGLGVFVVLLVLVVFKYLGLLVGVLDSLSSVISFLPQFEIDKLLLPLGLSYIVFKHISYLTDVKWGIAKPGRFIDFLLYSSLFTIFVAGPIERFERFSPQVEKKVEPLKWEDFDYSIIRILVGMVKKLIIADWLAYSVEAVFANPHSFSIWSRSLALLGYSLQIYFDFAGYSDIAIGSSRLFGLKIMENFKNPYLSPNISQFWRKWHISLSDWIRDYLFFPLSRVSSRCIWLVFFVPVTAMAICGLWHGAEWHYVYWGLWHGLLLSIYQIWSNWKRQHKEIGKRLKNPYAHSIAVCFSFVFITFGWTLFRMPLQEALSFLSNFHNPSVSMLVLSGKKMVLILGTTVLTFGVVPLVERISAKKDVYFMSFRYLKLRWVSIVIMIWILIFAGNTGGQSFMYFQF